MIFSNRDKLIFKVRKMFVLFAILMYLSFISHVAYSQQNLNIYNSPNNKSAIVTTKEHTNETRIELTLKNDQSQNTQSFQIKDIYTALIAAVSAIGGGVIGAYATYRYGEEIEKGKDRRE